MHDSDIVYAIFENRINCDWIYRLNALSFDMHRIVCVRVNALQCEIHLTTKYVGLIWLQRFFKFLQCWQEDLPHQSSETKRDVFFTTEQFQVSCGVSESARSRDLLLWTCACCVRLICDAYVRSQYWLNYSWSWSKRQWPEHWKGYLSLLWSENLSLWWYYMYMFIDVMLFRNACMASFYISTFQYCAF